MSSDSEMSSPGWVIADDQAIISVPMIEDGEVVVRFMTDAEPIGAGASDQLPASVLQVLQLAGAWSDLDEADVLEHLDHLRHSARPSPPFAFET